MWLNLRPQKITKRVHGNCESGLVIIYKHAAHRLVQHRLQVMEVAWTDDSTLAIFFYMRYQQPPLHCSQKRLEFIDFDTGTVSQATKTMASTDCHEIMFITLAIE